MSGTPPRGRAVFFGCREADRRLKRVTTPGLCRRPRRAHALTEGLQLTVWEAEEGRCGGQELSQNTICILEHLCYTIAAKHPSHLNKRSFSAQTAI